MVYALSYKPAGSSYPNAERVERPDRLVVEDQTPDAGVYANTIPWESGGRVRPESVPGVIPRYGRRRLLNFNDQFAATVSDRFRCLVENIEPGVHQFEPVRFVNWDSELYEERWFWQVYNRLDSFDHEWSNGRWESSLYRLIVGIYFLNCVEP